MASLALAILEMDKGATWILTWVANALKIGSTVASERSYWGQLGTLRQIWQEMTPEAKSKRTKGTRKELFFIFYGIWIEISIICESNSTDLKYKYCNRSSFGILNNLYHFNFNLTCKCPKASPMPLMLYIAAGLCWKGAVKSLRLPMPIPLPESYLFTNFSFIL